MKLGTRGSKLALVQANQVAEQLRSRSSASVQVVVISTSGDTGSGGDKARWVDTIEAALVAGEIDLAVHSAKDVPMQIAAGTTIATVPERVDASDLLIGADSLATLAPGAKIGTSSLRRRSQLLALRPDLTVVDLRGNVDTRLARLEQSDLAAIVLASAALLRLGIQPPQSKSFSDAELLPAAGQGTLALQTRCDDAATLDAVQQLDHPPSHRALSAERSAVTRLSADCSSPVGVHARPANDLSLELSGYVGLPDGTTWLRDQITCPPEQSAAEAGVALAERMLATGASDLLAQAKRVTT